MLDNAEHLATALGIDLELARAEHPVGGFALDLIGQDLTHDAVLIVENQLGATDHGHLGQLITYAAGTGAKTIVWLTTQLREEHRQALDWLNEQTASDVRFFGVTVSIVRIEDSKPAPVNTGAAEPNDWQKQVRATTKAQTTGGKGELYRAFWERYLERLRATTPTGRGSGNPPPGTGRTSRRPSGAPTTAWYSLPVGACVMSCTSAPVTPAATPRSLRRCATSEPRSSRPMDGHWNGRNCQAERPAVWLTTPTAA